jgi:O-antigen/teichoic acid export membrane protein
MPAGPQGSLRGRGRLPGLGRLRGPGRLRGARSAGANLLDQVVIALANAGNALLALFLLPDRGRAGLLVLSLTVGYVVLSLNRAFVGEVLLALAARYPEGDEQRRRLVRDGLAAALAFGLCAAALLGATWALTAGPITLPRNIDLRDLGWVAAVLPFVLLHDTARYSHLADQAPRRALEIDITYVSVQGAAVLALVALDRISAGGLVLCWGLGAAAGFTLYALRTGHRPWGGRPRRWLAQTRHLSGWFVGTAVIGQFQLAAVAFLIGGRLSREAVAGFRFAQAVVLQPVQNFNQALMALLVPRISRLAGAADGEPRADGESRADGEPGGAAGALRREVRRAALALGGLGAALIAVGGLLAQLILPQIPRYADVAPLAWPMLLQGAIYMVQAPYTSALRGMHRARLQFAQYAIFTTASLTGLIIGSGQGLTGAAWGLAAGSAVGLVTTVTFYLYALRALHAPRSGPGAP